MTRISTFRLVNGALAALVLVLLAVLGSMALAAQDKYTLKVPDGLAFSEFKGYEAWQVVSISQDGDLIAAILANPVMIDAYLAGVPGNGKPFPDGAKMAKIHWNPKKMETFPAATVPGTQHDVDFMVKDSKRFADSGGWGWAVFDYDAASDTFTPGTLADQAAAGERRQVRVRVPYEREGKRLRFHGLRAQVKRCRANPISTPARWFRMALLSLVNDDAAARHFARPAQAQLNSCASRSRVLREEQPRSCSCRQTKLKSTSFCTRR